ncbi:hypothetical protein OESDEN_07913 [Oesophagostomum dentatum]|uniref:Uncharacterized protein n=1 Tax=Oesophagostomum dentatum TaxID=61180 RepID=A0A0B1T4R1_OESDE|nr:hypothetical protein OESDEN_07913 [Oesophagostomum dentatum]
MTGWHNKYGWAVALIVIFCILVVIAVVVWLIVWLINRAKDKREKRDITYDQTSFASQTPLPANEIAPVEQYSFEPPYSRDYRY